MAASGQTHYEPQGGVVSYFKVFSGEIKPGDELINANNGELERISQIFVAEGKERTAVDKLVAGDLGVTVKLKSGHSNNTLNTKGVDRKIEPMKFPESRLRKAVFVENTAETEKLFAALNKLKEEDPTLKVEIDHDTHEAILGGQGQLHLDLVKYRLEKIGRAHV